MRIHIDLIPFVSTGILFILVVVLDSVLYRKNMTIQFYIEIQFMPFRNCAKPYFVQVP